MPRALASVSGPTGWNDALDIISFGSPEQVSNLHWSILFFFFFPLHIHFLIVVNVINH